MTQQEIVDHGLPVFPRRTQDECSIGFPSGSGIRLGYEGWGRIDVAMDPRLPVNMCILQMGLKGMFRKVSSVRLLNVVHGDCNLTHAIQGLLLLVAPGGELSVSFLSTARMAEDAVSFLSRGKHEECQRIEKFCFAQPVDHSGMVFQQTFLDEQRVHAILCDNRDFLVSIEKRADSTNTPLHPDNLRLEGITDEEWSSGEKKIEDSLSVDRPRCVMCGRPATKRDSNRKYFSRYCKDHYYEARRRCDKYMLESYTIRMSAKRKNTIKGAQQP